MCGNTFSPSRASRTVSNRYTKLPRTRPTRSPHPEGDVTVLPAGGPWGGSWSWGGVGVGVSGGVVVVISALSRCRSGWSWSFGVEQFAAVVGGQSSRCVQGGERGAVWASRGFAGVRRVRGARRGACGRQTGAQRSGCGCAGRRAELAARSFGYGLGLGHGLALCMSVAVARAHMHVQPHDHWAMSNSPRQPARSSPCHCGGGRGEMWSSLGRVLLLKPPGGLIRPRKITRP